jgi:hypothetical protein
VCHEKRGDRNYYKLRFRRNGRQVVRYIGNAERAAAVVQELAVLQHKATVMRVLKANVKLANNMLKEAIVFTKPMLEANGYVFHGRAIRRPHVACNEVDCSKNES